MAFPVIVAYRCGWWGWRSVSDIIRQLSNRLPRAALCRVSRASRNLPLLRQHLQLLADQGGAEHCCQQLRLHADRRVAAEGQHREVQCLHEGVTRITASSSCSIWEQGWVIGLRRGCHVTDKAANQLTNFWSLMECADLTSSGSFTWICCCFCIGFIVKIWIFVRNWSEKNPSRAPVKPLQVLQQSPQKAQ